MYFKILIKKKAEMIERISQAKIVYQMLVPLTI